jgi:hypothetical protein
MHTAATWLELAAHTRAAADGMSDRAERRAMLAIVADYEWQAHVVAVQAEPGRPFGACSPRVW